MDEPALSVLFLGFGASSLDFQLRAWTRDDYIRVSSDLRVAMNAALVAAGIEIPFPQRDIHLRSIDENAADVLLERGAEDRKSTPD